MIRPEHLTHRVTPVVYFGSDAELRAAIARSLEQQRKIQVGDIVATTAVSTVESLTVGVVAAVEVEELSGGFAQHDSGRFVLDITWGMHFLVQGDGRVAGPYFGGGYSCGDDRVVTILESAVPADAAAARPDRAAARTGDSHAKESRA